MSASIYVIDADGSHETRLLHGGWPAWSPDGKKIAFVDGDGVEVIDADGSNKRLILRHNFRVDTYQPSDMGVVKPVWSPDGKRIAFEHLGDGFIRPSQVFVMSADGANPYRASVDRDTVYAESDPAWSRDGSQLAYWTAAFGLVFTDATGGRPQPVYRDFFREKHGGKPVWSPDGIIMAFNYRGSGSSGPWSVGAFELLSGGFVTLVRDGYDLAYSPDQKRIAYTSARGDITP